MALDMPCATEYYHGILPCVTLNKGKKEKKVIIVSVMPQTKDKVEQKKPKRENELGLQSV